MPKPEGAFATGAARMVSGALARRARKAETLLKYILMAVGV